MYVHKYRHNDIIFYVGKGTNNRLNKIHERNRVWADITKNNEWYAEIFQDNLTETDALDLEFELIKQFNPVANISRKHGKNLELDELFIRDNYEYDENSPTGLSYKEKDGIRKVGKYGGAGFLVDGYYRIKGSISRRNVAVQRIVWLLVKGEDPGDKVIDHIDGNKSNNKIDNLRLVSVKENCRNLKIRDSNTLRIPGIRLGGNCYVAAWYNDNGKRETRSFNIDKYGKELALELSVYFRKLMIEDKGYSERHLGTFEFKILNSYNELDLNKMLEDTSRVDNLVGVNGVTFDKRGEYSYWCFKNKDKIIKRYSVLKFGENVAKALAIEFARRFNNSDPKPILDLSIEKTNTMLENRRNNTDTGNKYIYKYGDVLRLYITSNGRTLSKQINIKNCDYHEVMSKLIEIRDNFLSAE